jgi:acetolactate synthase-1/2/3 large subunit
VARAEPLLAGAVTAPTEQRPDYRGAGEAIIDILQAAGVRRMYAVPGESFLEVLDAADRRPDFMLISTRHESGAAFMAEADAKITGIPAVAAATRGVGAANLSIGVHTAMQDSTPMVVLVGHVDTAHLGFEAFQEIDLAAFYAPITKFAAVVHHVDRLPDTLARAVISATSGRPGPAVLALPADVLRGQVSAAAVAAAQRAVSVRRTASVPGRDSISVLATRLAEAARPVIIAGAGAQSARTELISFAETYDLGVYAAFRRQDVFPNDHPNYLGHLTLGTPPPCLRSLEAADVVLVLGARLDEVTSQSFRLPARHTEVIHVDADPSVPGAALPADWAVTADVGALLAELTARAPETPDRDWTIGHDAYLAASTPRRRATKDGIDPAAVLEAMIAQLPADAIITNDAGNFSTFVHSYWRYTAPRSQLGPVSGAMGYAVPAAVAAAIGNAHRTVVATVGDGGFLMSGIEVETAVRHGLNMIVVVFRNGLYGTIAMHQLRELGRTSAVAIGTVDIAGLARSLGARGIAVNSERDLRPALSIALDRRGVTVLDVRVDTDLATPGIAFSELTRRTA